LSGKDSDDEVDTLNQEEDGFLNASDAIKIVRDPESNTRAPDAVEGTIWQRINRYFASYRFPVALLDWSVQVPDSRKTACSRH
jgi:hypothetical protein